MSFIYNEPPFPKKIFEYGGKYCLNLELKHPKLILPVGGLKVRDINKKPFKLDGLCRLNEKSEGDRYLKDCIFDTGNEVPLILIDKSYFEHFTRLYGGYIHKETELWIQGSRVEATIGIFQFQYVTIEFESRIGFVVGWRREYRQRIYFGMNIFCQMISTIEPHDGGVCFYLKNLQRG